MLLAETQHHAVPRGQNKARSGGEVRVARHGQDLEERLLQPEPFGAFDEEPGGGPPGWSGTPASTSMRSVLYVPILDVPMPQMGEQLAGQFLQVPGRAVPLRASYRRAQDP